MARNRRRSVRADAEAVTRQLREWERMQRGRAAGAIRELERLIAERDGIVHAIGSALAEIADQRLYRQAGFTSFTQFLAARSLGRAQAYKWIAIARALDSTKAATMGVEKAYRVSRRRKRRA
jgi:hypothetical protein